jgi:hypothetical protein
MSLCIKQKLRQLNSQYGTVRAHMMQTPANTVQQYSAFVNEVANTDCSDREQQSANCSTYIQDREASIKKRGE